MGILKESKETIEKLQSELELVKAEREEKEEMKKRLIDADALDFKFDRRCFSEEDENYVRGVDEAIGVVKNAPTINPDDLVKHGEWMIRGGRFRCSECDSKALLKEDGGSGGFREFVQVKSNYCPNCGAKMDGGKENE